MKLYKNTYSGLLFELPRYRLDSSHQGYDLERTLILNAAGSIGLYLLSITANGLRGYLGGLAPAPPFGSKKCYRKEKN